MKLHNLFTLLLLFALLALPFGVSAQDSELPPVELPAWASALPSVLLGLMAFNFRSTEWFKRTMASASDSKRVPFELPKEVQGTFVLLFSVGLGLGSAWVVPHANDFVLGQYPDMPLWGAVLCTGFLISVVGGLVYELFSRLGGSKRVFKQTTEVSAPSAETPASTANKALDVAAQVAKG